MELTNNKKQYISSDIERTIDVYGDMLFRICYIILKSRFDAEDAVQETFIKFFQKAPDFVSEEHKKAWLIKVATNKSRDISKTRKSHNFIDVETVAEQSREEDYTYVTDALMSLPDKYKTVLYLHYVEGYKSAEIAKIIGKTDSAVKMRLKKGRELLKEKLEERHNG